MAETALDPGQARAGRGAGLTELQNRHRQGAPPGQPSAFQDRFLTPPAACMVRAMAYEALKEAGASDEKAREAAEEIAGFENRLTNIEGELKLIKWMLGFNLAATAAIIVMLFRTIAT